MACGEGAYTWIRGQWRVGRGHIPGSGANGVWGGGIYLDQGAMACGEGAYTWIRGQCRVGKGHIPGSRANGQRDWSPRVIGPRAGYTLSRLPRLVPAP
eukprot:854678-Prorocentrum_minimum.AAC.1